MRKPFLTVVIPTLNEEKLLPRLLASLSSQVYRDFEVILIDAKSKDKTVTLARKFKRKIPGFKIYLSNKKNVGFQRNMGAGKAKGKYLVFFDADVVVPENFLDEVAAHLKKEKTELLTTWLMTENRKLQSRVIETTVNVMTEMAKMINKPFAGGYNLVVKRSLFKRMGGFDEEIVHGEDHEFTMRCYEAGVELLILKYPRLFYSTRRFDKYGFFNVLKKDATSAIQAMSGKPMKKLSFDYQMGGEY
jgi:glycosyltransferase involved in cell wall biosynthesis